MPSTDQVSVVITQHPYGKTIQAFRASLAQMKDDLVVQAGKLEFAEADAKMRVAQLKLQQTETMTLAAQVRRMEVELETFVLEHKSEGM